MDLRQRLRKKRHLRYLFYAMPILIFWFVMTIYPNLKIMPLSFFEWSPLNDHKEFVGLYNFKVLFTYQWKTTKKYIFNTLLYVFYLFGVQTVLALALALSLKKNRLSDRFFRALFFLPMVLSTTMVSLTWSYMYDPNLGIINNALGALKVNGFPGHNFFKPDAMALLAIVLVHIWANIGYPITILTSGLQSIPKELYDAATIDGAKRMQIFRKITFPLLLPTLLRNTLLTITTGSMAIDYILMMGSRMVPMSYDTWSVNIYKSITMDTTYGMVSARSTVLFLLLLAVCLVQYLVTKRVEDRMYN